MKDRDYQYRSYTTIASAMHVLSNHFENIAFPIKNSFYYDLIVESSFKLFRVKVIYTNCKQPSGSYIANIRKSGGYSSGKEQKSPFNPKFCDLLFIETPDGQYLIPSQKVLTIKSITLSQFQNCRISSAVEQEPVKFLAEGSIPSSDV